MATDDFVIVGTLGRPRGLSGEINIVPETDFPERFTDLDEIYVRDRKVWKKTKIVSFRFSGKRPVVRFKGITSREDAARLVNRDLAVLKEEVVELPEGEHYVFDIIGCRVYLEENPEAIGKIVDVQRYPANDVYLIRLESGKDILFPAVDQFIRLIDVDEKKIVIDKAGLTDNI